MPGSKIAARASSRYILRQLLNSLTKKAHHGPYYR